MLTLVLLTLPAVAALVILLTRSAWAKQIALGAALAELGITVVASAFFVPDASVQYALNYAWIPDIGADFHVGMDGISLLLVLLTSFCTPIAVFTSFRKQVASEWVYYALLLFTQSALVGVFVSLNGFLFYIFWEAVLIPVYFLSAFWGGENRVRITFKFFIYTVVGSFFMLLAFIFLYLQTNGGSFDANVLHQLALDRNAQLWVFGAFFIAFAIKIPLFPFHTWQPGIYSEAPTSVTMILSALMGKMAIYGLFRWVLPIVPNALAEMANTVLVVTVIGIIYASIAAIAQGNVKRLIAFSSIAHLGLIAAGIFAHNAQGLQGAMFQMLTHGIGVVGLFYVVDLIESRTGTVEINKLGAIIKSAPLLATGFLVIVMGSIALPFTGGFWGEFLLLMGVTTYDKILGLVCTTTIVIGAVYMLRMYYNTMLRTHDEAPKGLSDLNGREFFVLYTLVVLTIAMGLFPKFFMDIAAPALENILTNGGIGTL